MFAVSDRVNYGANGVCEIADIVEKNFCGQVVKYFVLRPVFSVNAQIFVPVENKELTSKMLQVLSKNEVESLVNALPVKPDKWTNDNSNLGERFRQAVGSGDRLCLAKLIETISVRRKELATEGKRLRMSDEKIMNDAKKLLYNEIAYVLKIDPDQVVEYIESQIQKR
ncbi:MAG: CarD family transcriptional regulator [bacterium]|nr:CarD family transcriptional regulator [bacterium]